MNPRDFLDVADDLLDGSREADWRSGVSRAYYAAFLTAVELFEEAGFAVPADQASHAYIRFRMSNCGHSDVVLAGRRLGALREARGWADYERHRSMTLRFAVEQVGLARDIIQLLDDLAESEAVLARIVDAIRVYERDVLNVVTFRAPAS